jgi:hypothetical protein
MPKTIISVKKGTRSKEPATLTPVHGGRVNVAGFTIVINQKTGHMAWF